VQACYSKALQAGVRKDGRDGPLSAQVEAAGGERQEGGGGCFRQTAEKEDPRGRKAKGAAPKADVGEAVGISERDLTRAEHHVALAEQLPCVQKWWQSEGHRFRWRIS
jgi:hypothetical protein